MLTFTFPPAFLFRPLRGHLPPGGRNLGSLRLPLCSKCTREPCRTFLLAFSIQPCYNSPRCRVRISAIIVASQASEAGSIPVPCSKEQPSFRYNGMTVILYPKLLFSKLSIDKTDKMPVYTHFNSLNSWQESLQDGKLYDIIKLTRWCFYEVCSR